MTLKKVLFYFTGSEDVPSTVYVASPSLMFNHTDNLFPKASTCAIQARSTYLTQTTELCFLRKCYMHMHSQIMEVIELYEAKFLCSGKDLVMGFFWHVLLQLSVGSHLFDCIVTHIQILQRLMVKHGISVLL